MVVASATTGGVMQLKFRDIVEFLFLPLLTIVVFLLWELNKSISTLNIQVGVLIERSVNTDEKVKDLTARVQALEHKQKEKL